MFNQAFGIFPCGASSVAVVPWTKRNPAQVERVELQKLNVRLATSSLHSRTAVWTRYGRLAVLICSELLEPQALSGLLTRVELVTIPSWNMDTQSYDHMLKSGGLLVHAYMAVANNGSYSDCRIWAPFKSPSWGRDVCRLIQRGSDEVVWEDLSVEHLREFHEGIGFLETSRSRPPNLEWRPLPPSWEHGPTSDRGGNQSELAGVSPPSRRFGTR